MEAARLTASYMLAVKRVDFCHGEKRSWPLLRIHPSLTQSFLELPGRNLRITLWMQIFCFCFVKIVFIVFWWSRAFKKAFLLIKSPHWAECYKGSIIFITISNVLYKPASGDSFWNMNQHIFTANHETNTYLKKFHCVLGLKMTILSLYALKWLLSDIWHCIAKDLLQLCIWQNKARD